MLEYFILTEIFSESKLFCLENPSEFSKRLLTIFGRFISLRAVHNWHQDRGDLTKIEQKLEWGEGSLVKFDINWKVKFSI